jgi:two-component system sensor histidine kinase ChvG
MKPFGRLGLNPAAATRSVSTGSRVAPPSRRRRFSTLTLRILAPNVLTLGILVGGIFYLDQYRDGLLDAKVAALQVQAEMIAGALGQSALSGPLERRRIDPAIASGILRRMAQPAGARARLYGKDGLLIADSRYLVSAGRQVQLRYLPPPDTGDDLIGLLDRFYDWVIPRMPHEEDFPRYSEALGEGIKAFPEATAALSGNISGAVRALDDGALIVNVAAPVQQLWQVVGVLMLSADSADIEEGVRNARVAIIEAFVLALGLTFLLSLFLAGTISRPLRRLANAADRVRRWRGQRVQIPDLTRRRDEIGDLSATLGEMTKALYDRLDAIEVFAADVAHEIKNPITSMRSALETFYRTNDDKQRERLLSIMMEDVQRLDRLISDISNASRVDAEMARAESELVDLTELLQTAADLYRARSSGDKVRFTLDLPAGGGPFVEGIAGRLGQVVHNLINNAISFSTKGAEIALAVKRSGDMAVITVEDQGPGIQDGKEDAIFDRFYSQRSAETGLGRHSGLGLSICRQIVDAHGGTIAAENRRGSDGKVVGARFTVRLPMS